MKRAASVFLVLLGLGTDASADPPPRSLQMGLFGSTVFPATRDLAHSPGGSFLWTLGYETEIGLAPQMVVQYAQWSTETRSHGSLGLLGGVAFSPLRTGPFRPFWMLDVGAGTLEDSPLDYREDSARSASTRFPTLLLLTGGGAEVWTPGNELALGAHLLWGSYVHTRGVVELRGSHLVAGLHVTLGPPALQVLGGIFQVLGALR